MKLIERVQGKKPPYGIILLGENQELVKIENAPDKQRWLDAVIDEMRSILDGVPAAPTPGKAKCAQCDVFDVCEHRMN
jgi:CRISPR/Cas system-associated exonuclease Cas4 (RecB family)